MTNDNPLEKTLRDAANYFKQQSELYGALEFMETDRSGDSPVAKPVEDFSDNSPKREADPMTKSRTIRVTEDDGLFEGSVLNASWHIDPHWRDSESIDELNSRISGCKKCPLGETRIKFVFGIGDPKSKLVFIGEAPGADEDEQGEPFVGRAGQLLNKILEAVQLKRSEVYICNILKCRPPNNREPLPTEIEACEPFLKHQLDIIKPKLIVCLGRVAGQALLKMNTSLAEFRNNTYEYLGIKVMVTYHPAALLRNPNWKRPAWEDFKKMRKIFDES